MSDMEISKMNFKQLRNEVQELRDELARFKRAYNDTIENLDDSNLSEYLIKEKEGMKTEIEVSADGIKALVVKNDELGERCATIEATADKIQTEVTKNKEDIGKFDSKLTQTAEEISSEVTAVKEDVGTFKTAINQRADSIESSVSAIETDVGEFNSTIEQTKDSITTAVNAAYSNPVEVNGFSSGTADKSKIYYNTANNKYYHYDGEKWVSGSNANFGTVFEQTADGFMMRGNVRITKIAQVDGDLYIGDYSTVENVKHIYFNSSANIRTIDAGVGGKLGIGVDAPVIQLIQDPSKIYVGTLGNSVTLENYVKNNGGGSGGVAVFG